MADESLGGQSAIAEARGLYRLLSTGGTVEQIRMLISVPPKIEAVLLAYAEADVRDAYWILAALRFRREVLPEFERPVADGVPAAEVPEPERVSGEVFLTAPAHAL